MSQQLNDLKSAVKDTLERNGALQKLQASIRSQIFGALLAAEDTTRPQPCDQTLLINELIREYLVFNGLRDTLSVFLPESGQPEMRAMDREFLARRLRLQETLQTQQVPLLYHLVARQQLPPPHQKQQQQRKEQQSQQQAGPMQRQPHPCQEPQQQHQQQETPAGRLELPKQHRQRQPLLYAKVLPQVPQQDLAAHAELSPSTASVD